mmetsp:Transcript_127/g.327  ORF Transcript_127/g.327 Transcript_127/m.327 type:complete len:272 (-) Transcript_127:531-1346(-)
MFWWTTTTTTKLILFAQILLALLLTAVDSFSMTMSAAEGSGKNPSILFVTNTMCPFAQKAWIALEAAEVPYKFEQISLYGGGGKPPWFMKLNPKGTVPVLVINNDNGNEKEQVVLADSDLILDEIKTVMDSVVVVTTEESLVTAPEDDATLVKIKAFRYALNEFLPIGKSAVLGGDKERMWSKLRELDALIDTKQQQTTPQKGPSCCFLAGTDKPTVADCAGFPFLWRIDNEFGSSSWESRGCSNIPVWLDLCKKEPAFAKSVQSSWWWWW